MKIFKGNIGKTKRDLWFVWETFFCIYNRAILYSLFRRLSVLRSKVMCLVGVIIILTHIRGCERQIDLLKL